MLWHRYTNIITLCRDNNHLEKIFRYSIYRWTTERNKIVPYLSFLSVSHIFDNTGIWSKDGIFQTFCSRPNRPNQYKVGAKIFDALKICHTLFFKDKRGITSAPVLSNRIYNYIGLGYMCAPFGRAKVKVMIQIICKYYRIFNI